MKNLYKSPKVNSVLPFGLKPVKVLAIIMICLCTGFQSFSQELLFQNPVVAWGLPGQTGTIYRFPNVTNGVDALVEIKGRSSSDVVLENIDVDNLGLGAGFQPKLGRTGAIAGTCSWWMEFEIRFVRAGTNLEVNVHQFKTKAIDIDGDDVTLEEYVELFKTTSCSLGGHSKLVKTFLGNTNNEKDYRLTGPLQHFLNISTDTDVMATAIYTQKSKFCVRFGAQQLGLGICNSGMRYNSLSFESFHFTAPSTLPVKLTSFNAALINKKVSLTWTTAQEKNASHFVIERSTSGVEFTDAGIIFTEGNSEIARSYSFKDPFSTSGNSILYYRLKMVDLDGQFQRSTIRIVKLGQSDGKLELQVFPNPVVNELRITIPESWQGKQVVYEVYTHDGQLLKRFTNKNATQTEMINMQFCAPGTYVIKALNDKEIASQYIIKGR